MQVGDRVRLIGLDGPEGPLGTVCRVLGGNAHGMVRVRWHDTRSSVRLCAAARLAPVDVTGSITIRRQCPDCGGIGFRSVSPCIRCNGTGKVTE